MPYVCGLDCNLVRNDSPISEKNPVSRIFVGQKKLTTEIRIRIFSDLDFSGKIFFKKNIHVGPNNFGQMRRCLRF